MAEDQVRNAFIASDLNQDGGLDMEEFVSLLKSLDPIRWTDAKAALFFRTADADQNGLVDLEEMLFWVFRSHAKSKDPPAEQDDDDSSSSSGSSEDEAASPSAADKRQQHRVARAKKREVPIAGDEEMYNLLCIYDGTIGRAYMEDLIEVFASARNSGLDARLPDIVPQACEAGECEELCPLELGRLCEMIIANRKVSIQDIRSQLLELKDDLRTRDQDHTAFKEVGIDIEAKIGFGLFKQVLDTLTALMHIDRKHLLAAFCWARVNRFEMTQAMANEVATKLFLKGAKNATPAVMMPISCNDFSRLIFSMGLLDATGKEGIPSGRIAIIFQDVLKHMKVVMKDLKDIRAGKKVSSKMTSPKSSKSKPRGQHHHKTVVGRCQLSILMEALYDALPSPRKYRSCMDMVLRFLEAARDKPLEAPKVQATKSTYAQQTKSSKARMGKRAGSFDGLDAVETDTPSQDFHKSFTQPMGEVITTADDTDGFPGVGADDADF